MDINKIKTAMDNIDEKYLLDAAEHISEKDISDKNNVNADELTILKTTDKKSAGKITKWLSVAAAFVFVVAIVAVVAVVNGNQIKTDDTNLQRPNVEDIITDYDEYKVSQWEKAQFETDKLHTTDYNGEYKIDGEYRENKTNHINYNGGEITIDIDLSTRLSTLELNRASVGFYVTINGVVQELTLDGEDIGQTALRYYTKEDMNHQYINDDFSISFTPTISEADKDKEDIRINLVLIRNPHLRVSPYYVTCASSHANCTVMSWKLHSDKPVENTVEESQGRFVSYKKTENEPLITRGFSLTGTDENKQVIKIEEDGSVNLYPRLSTYDEDGNNTYRIVFFVNGIPTVLADGSRYIEVATEPGCTYDFDMVKINGVKDYDTIDAITFVCDGTNSNIICGNSYFAYTIFPSDYEYNPYKKY